MTVKQEVRYQRNRKTEQLKDESRRHNIEAFAQGVLKSERWDEWRWAAMEWMSCPLWLNMQSKVAHKKQYERLHIKVIAAHTQWIDARSNSLEIITASKSYAQAIKSIIRWTTRGTGFGNEILGKAPKDL